jgi:phenylacetic acid degradation operon negative regulatory protein
VHTGALGRTDKAALRKRTRALSLLGFAELERGFHVRPDNLRGGVDGIRDRLRALGLEEDAIVFQAGAFDSKTEARIRRLWDGKALTASYGRTRRKLERWLERSGTLELEVAARESFLLGGQAIRQIVFDPLLPPPFVDLEERRAFVVATKAMDGEGRRIWRRFFDVAGAPAEAVTAAH